ncbi:MAG: hypothetical protein QM820_46230 [Minicystis sp.]
MIDLVPLLLLWILALTDGAFAGYRDAAGRDAHIFKADYYRRAIRRGMRFALGTSALSAIVAAAVVIAAPSPAARLGELLVAARWMLLVVGAYATVVLGALGLWAAAEADLRTLASVAVLGPFTLLRPWVIAAAGALGALRAPSTPAAITAVVVCGLQWWVEPWLGRPTPRTGAAASLGKGLARPPKQRTPHHPPASG